MIRHSGGVADDGKGPLDASAHLYRSLQLDEHGNPINKRNAWMTRSVAYVRLIPPGAADTVHYRLDIPPDAGGTSLRLDFDFFLIRLDWAYKIKNPAFADKQSGWFHKLSLNQGQFQLGINYPF